MDRDKFVSVVTTVTLIFAAMVVSGGVTYVVAYPSPSSSGYGEMGIYPGAPTYTIWRESSTYYAKDSNGHIPSWGETSNFTNVLQNALDSGGLTFISEGTYSYTGTPKITVNTTTILGEGKDKTIFNYTGNSDALQIGNNTLLTVNVKIKDLSIKGSATSSNVGVHARNVREIILENLEITYFNSTSDSAAIIINATTIGSHHNKIIHLTTDVTRNGIIIDSNDVVGANANEIYGGNIVNNGVDYGYAPNETCGIRNGHISSGSGVGGGDGIIFGTSIQGFHTGVKLLGWRSDNIQIIGARMEFVSYGVNISSVTAEWNQIIGTAITASQARVISANLNWNMFCSSALHLNQTQGLKLPVAMSHPNITDWNQNFEGFMWYCNEHSAVEVFTYKAGTGSIIYWNATGTGELS